MQPAVPVVVAARSVARANQRGLRTPEAKSEKARMGATTKEPCQVNAPRWNAAAHVAMVTGVTTWAARRGLQTPCTVVVAGSADDAVGDQGSLDGALSFDAARGFEGSDAVGLGHGGDVERLLDKHLR